MKKTLTILTLVIVAAGIFASCNEERGCTDSYADNFDPEATQDDDTCIPTREKFIGDYESHGTIEVKEDSLVSYDEVYVNITDSTASDENVGLILTIRDFDRDTYPLRAKVTATHDFDIEKQNLDPYTYWGNGSISGRVLSVEMTRVEKIEVLPEEYEYDTLYLNLYGLQEIEE